MGKYVCLISIFIPAILSYFFWTCQVINQSRTFNELKEERFYLKWHDHEHFRHLYCWFDQSLNIAIFVVAFLFIAANFYLSIIKGFTIAKKISGQLKERVENEGGIVKKQYDDINHIKRTLLLYPFISAFIWISFFIIQMLYIRYKGELSLLSFFGCLLISVRQIIYVIVFLATQKDIYRKLIEFIFCKSHKKKRKIDVAAIHDSINEIERGSNLVPEDS